MPSTKYVPTRDADLVGFAENFSNKITAAPTAFGLTALQATAFAGLYTSFNTAYTTLQNPQTKSPFYTAAKDAARDALVNGNSGIRELAALVQAHPGITDQQLIDLRLTVRDTQPSPIDPPTVSPEIDFLPTGTRTIRIRLHNETIGQRGKPAGVRGAMVFYHVGTTPPPELVDWTFHESITRTRVDVNLPVSVASGSTVWFTAYWFNPRQQSGPATTPVSTIVQFGGLSQAA